MKRENTSLIWPISKDRLGQRFWLTATSPVTKLDARRLQIGFMVGAKAHSDERVHLLGAEPDNAARPVIFEAPADQPPTIGEKGGGERVAGIARQALSIEGEAERPIAVDQSAEPAA
jgi:hypothetical protein